MFAFRSQIEFACRSALIVTLMFSALSPRVAFAQSSISGDELTLNSSKESGGTSLVKDTAVVPSQYQTYSRPIPRTSDESSQPVLIPPESADVRLKGTTSGSSRFPPGSTTCTDPNPAISISESFHTDAGVNWYTGGQLRMKLECTGANCAPPDIYYHAILDGTFATTTTFGSCGQNCFWGADLHAYINFITTATWGDSELVCGTTPSGTCHFELSGMIPGEMISSNTSTWSSKYFDILAYINNAASWEHLETDVTISASLDPDLLNSQLPSESANCKGGCFHCLRG